MEFNNIRKIIGKYFEATTTIARRNSEGFFYKGESSFALKKNISLFQYFSIAKKNGLPSTVPLKT